MDVYTLLAESRLLMGPRFAGLAIWEMIKRNRGSIVADVPGIMAKVFPGEAFDEAIFRDWLRQLKNAGILELTKDGETWLIKAGRGSFALANDPAPAKKRKAKDLSPVVLKFPCSGKVAEWGLTEAQIAEWQRLFPDLDILQCCRSALAWVLVNTKKTARGTPRFLVSWFEKDMRDVRRSIERGSFGAIQTREKPRGDLSRAFEEFAARG